MPAWAYREQMTVALVSSAELTVLLPYITPPIVLFFSNYLGRNLKYAL